MLSDKDKPLSELMGRSLAVHAIIKNVNRVAKTNFTVLIEGETGTGKELVANAIHRLSKRHDDQFIVVDCGAIPETLIESELFGHEKGAFTGAHQRKDGYFYLANNGTIFLDEISNLPLTSQCKLLRAIEERRIHPVGGKMSIPLDVRIIAASNIPLDREVTAGRFRNDLYHRLNEFCIILPPLRNRQDDIIFLAGRFIKDVSQELKKEAHELSREAVECMLNYQWPGNVRELMNVIRRATLEADAVIEPNHLNIKPASPPNQVKCIDVADISLANISDDAKAKAEKSMIQRALKISNGNKSKATRLLKISYKTLYNKIKKYGLDLKTQ